MMSGKNGDEGFHAHKPLKTNAKVMLAKK